MSKSDEELIIKVFLIIIGIGILIFVFWLIATTIQFLSEHLFVYGLIVGLFVGGFATYAIPKWVIPWWKYKFIPWLRSL